MSRSTARENGQTTKAPRRWSISIGPSYPLSTKDRSRLTTESRYTYPITAYRNDGIFFYLNGYNDVNTRCERTVLLSMSHRD